MLPHLAALLVHTIEGWSRNFLGTKEMTDPPLLFPEAHPLFSLVIYFLSNRLLPTRSPLPPN